MVKKSAEGNISFVTGTAGYLLAGEVVRDILAVSDSGFTQHDNKNIALQK